MRHETSVEIESATSTSGLRLAALEGVRGDGGREAGGGWCFQRKTTPADALPAKLQVELISRKGVGRDCAGKRAGTLLGLVRVVA